VTPGLGEQPVRRHRLRTDIYQASWNYRHKGAFPLLILVVAVTLGVSTESWLIGLVTFVTLTMMPHFGATRGIVSLLWGVVCAGIGYALLSGFGTGAAVVGAVIGFALAWVPMRASEQYWRDLEKDGGPYSD